MFQKVTFPRGPRGRRQDELTIEVIKGGLLSMPEGAEEALKGDKANLPVDEKKRPRKPKKRASKKKDDDQGEVKRDAESVDAHPTLTQTCACRTNTSRPQCLHWCGLCSSTTWVCHSWCGRPGTLQGQNGTSSGIATKSLRQQQADLLKATKKPWSATRGSITSCEEATKRCTASSIDEV